MEESKTKIKEASWIDVINYLETYANSEVKSELYHKLSKLYEIYNRATKLSRHTWFENYKEPAIENRHWGELYLTPTKHEKLHKEIDGLNSTIYHFLTDLDSEIMKYMQKYYALASAYQQSNKESVKTELKQKLSKNIVEDKYIAKNTMDAYYYLLKLQSILSKLKEVKNNEEIEGMLKLVSHTKAQLKQIVYDLDCRIFATSTNEIEIAKRLPDGMDERLYYTQKPAMENLIK